MNKVLLAVTVSLLGTCGFHPKDMGGTFYPLPYQAWHIANGQVTQQALDKALRYADGKLVGTDEVQAVLIISHTDTHKDIYTITHTAEINEYSPILRVEAQASANGEPLDEPITAVANCKMDYTNSDVLGKAGEKQIIWLEICTDAVEQIMYRLTFLKAPQ